MKVEIKVPPSGESVIEATIAVIMVENGVFVNKDEEILELETDKVNQVIYAPDSGVLSLTTSLDATVKPNQIIGFIDTEGKGKKKGVAAPMVSDQKEEKAPSSPILMPRVGEGVRRSVDDYVASIEQGNISSSPPPIPEVKPPSFTKALKKGQTRKRMSGLRRTIAKRLVEAKNTTAMLTTFNEVDMSAVIEIRAREKDPFMKQHGVKLGFMSFFVKACCVALKEFPDVNAFIDGDEIVFNEGMHISISVSTPKGLMVPVLRNAEKLTFSSVEKGVQTFATKARDGTLSIEDLQGGTFTITNGGVFGSMLSTPILNPPQSAILGMHNIIKRPVVIGDTIEIRSMMYLALSYDHRIIDGKEAVTFLVRVKELLEKPDRLLLGETDD